VTQKRIDAHSTEFGLWLREQPDIDSSIGYIATNIDYVWKQYKTGEWMLIEEKRFGAQVKRWQRDIFSQINLSCKCDPLFRGFHLIVFEKTSPTDGATHIDGHPVTVEQLISFLQFKEYRITHTPKEAK
jgi:hypothetical protein